MKKFLGLVLVLAFLPSVLQAKDSDTGRRYYFEGDGRVRLINAKTGKGATFTYRDREGYILKAFDDINLVFGLKTAPDEFMSPRLIALLDYLQDELKGGAIRIVSGYRSPAYNEGLRKKGKLAARTSLHIEGMAADVEMDLVEGKHLWEYVRSLDCCGAGYYQGKGIHVDTGPSRFWDQTSTKVEQDLGAKNKLLLVNTNFDYYEPGERIYLTLGRITDYPFGIRSTVTLVDGDKDLKTVDLDLKYLTRSPSDDTCLLLKKRSDARSVEFNLPPGFKPKDKVKVRLDFCQKPSEDMPPHALSNAFSLR